MFVARINRLSVVPAFLIALSAVTADAAQVKDTPVPANAMVSVRAQTVSARAPRDKT